MSTDWAYAQLAKKASEHGGPQAYLDDLKAGSKADGRTQGLLVGAVLAAIALKGYHHLMMRKEAAATAERELLEAIEAASEGDGRASGEDDSAPSE